MLADVDVDALNASGDGLRLQSGIDFTGKKKDIRDALKDLYDKEYEQNAPSSGQPRSDRP